MTQSDIILTLSVAFGAFFFVAIYNFFTAEQHYRRSVAANQLAEQYAGIAATANEEAEKQKTAQEQATGRANLLAAHITELEVEKENLEHRILYLTGLIKYLDRESISRMAVMDGPLVWLPKDDNEHRSTINLN